MFTGIIENIGEVKSIGGGKLIVKTSFSDIKIGDSIAVNGVCLTAVSFSGDNIAFDYSPNTDSLTNLAQLKQSSKVNLERALTLSSRLGGHIVLGHIEGTAKIIKIEKQDRFFRISFSCGENILKYCRAQGSIAIDGISLTISSVSKDCFETFIIPQTFENTNMKLKRSGDNVNIETDIIIKYLENLILGKDRQTEIGNQNSQGNRTEFKSELKNKKSDDSLIDTLKNNGFI